MSTPRSLQALHPAQRDDIADLITRRPLPGPKLADLDPFLFLNHHGPQLYPAPNHGLPFGPHPHRGFETVTFILAGDLMHRDSGGHESIIGPGGVQWMTAGSGLTHAELSSEAFKAAGGPLEILQLWVNLPARLKLTKPRYTGLQADAFPVSEAGNATVTVVSGEIDGVKGPIHTLTDITMAMVALRPGAHVILPAPAAHTVFLYVVRGTVQVGGQAAPAHHLATIAPDGDAVVLNADADAFVLFGHAAPYHEPIVSYGPFVMNTRQEIEQAFADYEAGKFGKPL